jgi:hypothetical protein
MQCPSAPAKPGAMMLGRFDTSGRLGYMRQPIVVDKGFLESARHSEQKPEAYFRFTSSCLNQGCAQWSAGGCGVARGAMQVMNNDYQTDLLPICAIRQTCRWHAQEGSEICHACQWMSTMPDLPGI